MEGDEADPDYFGRDTGDASLDDARNQDEIGENEILVVSFGTSFNDSRAKDIKAIEDALQAAYPDYSVRRAFTAQIIINHVQARDNECIDNMQQALDRAVANGVKHLVVQPTHLMHGAEYDEMTEAVNSYADIRCHCRAPAGRSGQRCRRDQRRQKGCGRGCGGRRCGIFGL